MQNNNHTQNNAQNNTHNNAHINTQNTNHNTQNTNHNAQKTNHNTYQNPLCNRYASKQMQQIFSDQTKFSTWRKLWVALAQSQMELGLNITQEQIDQMNQHLNDIDFEKVKQIEAQTRHDVMAHIHLYGEICPLAKPIIHLGATSCYVGDNTDIIVQITALNRIKMMLINLINALKEFANKHKSLNCLAYTHFQSAQPTTLGKRATLWLQELVFDFDRLTECQKNLKLLGCKGTTGTSASFLSLFNGDQNKVKQLEEKICKYMGVENSYDVCGQTYSRKIDYFTLSVLSGIAQSAHKFANDIRLLSHLKEVDEPFESGQVGSSAMAYKRNPMRCERITALSRFVQTLALNPALTASEQWFERTLDDSANKRLAIPQAYLAVDGILSLYYSVISGLTVYPNVIKKHLDEELPFMATENILMHCVNNGGDRQKLHELIRIHSVNSAKKIKEDGGENDLLARIASDKEFNLTLDQINQIINSSNFSGLAQNQTEEFIKKVEILINNHQDLIGKMDVKISV